MKELINVLLHINSISCCAIVAVGLHGMASAEHCFIYYVWAHGSSRAHGQQGIQVGQDNACLARTLLRMQGDDEYTVILAHAETASTAWVVHMVRLTLRSETFCITSNLHPLTLTPPQLKRRCVQFNRQINLTGQYIQHGTGYKCGQGMEKAIY